MSNKLKKQKSASSRPARDSVIREAWDNMNDDMAKFLPDFLLRWLQRRQGKLWVVVVMTLLELVVLGIIGKLIYDWLAG